MKLRYMITALALTAAFALSASDAIRISGERLRKSSEQNLLRALSGMVSGLTVTQTGTETHAYIRGQRSLMLNNEPLYMVDGMEVESLDMVSIYDVDRVEVHKSAPEYGARGANGAIIVKTKPRQ